MKSIQSKEIVQAAMAKQGPLRTAIYSRVSTDMEIQEGSFELQNRYFLQRIEHDPAMTLAGVYGDLGKSGRMIRRRNGFQCLMKDCEAGKIDLIITKSISRFARNFVDCMESIRRCMGIGVRIIFDENGIDTADLKSELLLSILATIAEEESNSISANLQWAHDERAKRGEPLTHPPYGYRRRKKSPVWTIEEHEARRVRMAFELRRQRQSYAAIARTLNTVEQAETTGKVWSKHMVATMLANIAYKGDLLTAKMVRVGNVVKRNEGEKEQYYLEEHHPPIINRALFDQVQALRRSRAEGGREAA